MINNSLNNRFDLITSMVQPNSDNTPTLTAELKSIAPEMVQELLSQFSEEKVEQLLQQQLASLTTLPSQPNTPNYQYSDEELALIAVVTSQQEGLLNNENSDKLMARLNQSVADIHTAYASTSDILSSLGQLGHQQKSFLATSEQRVERALGSYIEKANRFDNEDKDNNLFELSIRTKEGDIVNITFNSSQGYDEAAGKTVDGFSLSYEVDGSLSEAEHQALTEVLSGVGEMADEFFKVKNSSYGQYVPAGQIDFNLGFIAGLNNEQLSGFDVSFSTSEGRKATSSENTLDMSYQFSQISQEQTLVFESNNGQDQIDFSLDMSIFGEADVRQMEQYLTTMDKNLEDSRHKSKGEGKVSAFGRQGDEDMRRGFAVFKEAFASMSSAAQRYSNIESVAAQQFTAGQAMVADLADNMITHDPRYQGLGNDTDNTLGAGISKLADFDAKFSFLSGGKELRPKSSVEMNQATQQNKSEELNGVTQNKTVTTNFTYQSSRPDYYKKTESYEIDSAVKNQQLTGLDQKHDVSIDQKVYRPSSNASQYDLMMARTEQTTNESNIRLIDDIWLETNENSHTMDKRERIADSGKGRPEDFKNTNQHSYNKLVTLIGDLDTLAENENLKRNYLNELNEVNFFMNKNK
jgi:hypothetical protein